MNIESFANDLIDLVAENADLRRRLVYAEHYKALYWAEVEAGRKHGEAMIGGMLELCLIPGVMDSLKATSKGERDGCE